MGQDPLPYDRMLQDALRGVVREALARVAQHGLPPRHHFYLTFRTDHPEVELAPRLRAQYPVEMTIVLQHQFYDPEVGTEGFAVTLNFGKVPERVRVPFRTLTRFVDPPVNFGLQLTPALASGAPLPPIPSQPEALPAAKKPEEAAEAAKVVSLDSFRKL